LTNCRVFVLEGSTPTWGSLRAQHDLLGITVESGGSAIALSSQVVDNSAYGCSSRVAGRRTGGQPEHDKSHDRQYATHASQARQRRPYHIGERLAVVREILAGNRHRHLVQFGD
jgi:hypothetical protein